MPKIADIQETPNPNAVKFILKEPVSHGTSHSFKTAESAAEDARAPDAVQLHEKRPGNVERHVDYEIGAVDDGFAAAAPPSD